MLGYILATTIGLSLGLLGGGGSILTVPILVYVLKMDAKLSIALSLAIVGVTSLVGSYSHYKKGNLNYKIALSFAPIAMIGTFLGAKLSVFLSGATQLIIFAFVMTIAAFFMFKEKKSPEHKVIHNNLKKYALIIGEGLFVGILTGIVGVGGGFMIVPALVLLSDISMKEAVGTSLIIIALKSFSGFAGHIGYVDIPWYFLVKFSFFTIIGIIAGSHLVQHVSHARLQKMFAILLIVMGIFVLYKNRKTLINLTQADFMESLPMKSELV